MLIPRRYPAIPAAEWTVALHEALEARNAEKVLLGPPAQPVPFVKYDQRVEPARLRLACWAGLRRWVMR